MFHKKRHVLYRAFACATLALNAVESHCHDYKAYTSGYKSVATTDCEFGHHLGSSNHKRS